MSSEVSEDRRPVVQARRLPVMGPHGSNSSKTELLPLPVSIQVAASIGGPLVAL